MNNLDCLLQRFKCAIASSIAVALIAVDLSCVISNICGPRVMWTPYPVSKSNHSESFLVAIYSSGRKTNSLSTSLSLIHCFYGRVYNKCVLSSLLSLSPSRRVRD